MNESTQNTIGICADHGGFALKEEIKSIFSRRSYKLIDFGAKALNPKDDYPDFVLPMAQAVAAGELWRGIAICGSGVGACVAANKVAGVRAALIGDYFSAHQGVEDDDMNIICLGGRTIGPAAAAEFITAFLNAQFIGAERHNRRLDKIRQIEARPGATLQKI